MGEKVIAGPSSARGRWWPSEPAPSPAAWPTWATVTRYARSTSVHHTRIQSV